MALFYLEEGPCKYMEEYYNKLENNQPLGLWASFVEKMEVGYHNLNCKSKAARCLKEISQKDCKGDFQKFAEEFITPAHQSGYDDTSLIYCIAAKRLSDMADTKCNITLAWKSINIGPNSIPSKWCAYLDKMKEIDSNIKGDALLCKQPKHKTTSTVPSVMGALEPRLQDGGKEGNSLSP
jgi:hypothetical protein